jgi:hypothetical protein
MERPQEHMFVGAALAAAEWTPAQEAGVTIEFMSRERFAEGS